MRLLAAEIRLLRRPLVWGSAAAMALVCVLLALGGTINVHNTLRSPQRDHPATFTCAEIGQAPGPACDQALAVLQQAQRAVGSSRAAQSTDESVAAGRDAHRALHPIETGAMAAGLLASLPGAFLIALLAAGHVGAEWSGRTIKTVFMHRGRRGSVLAAKAVSLWLAGVAILAVCWVALALAGPILAAAYHLPAVSVDTGAALRYAGSQCARALVVLAFFSMLATMAAILTRNTVGTLAASAGAVVVTLIAAGFGGLGRWTPAGWVSGWMGFRPSNYIPTNFWARFIAGASTPTHTASLMGLTLTVAALAAFGLWRLWRMDVTV